jgi:hypothetical protein
MDGKNTAKPAPKRVSGQPVSSKAPSSSGQVTRSPQSGTTGNATDGGGGLGNSAVDLHNRIIGKK